MNDAPIEDRSTPERRTPEAKPANEERVSTVLADRPCVKCLFNLAGQPVVRESRYNLLIVRCPECGSVAAIQEYPHLTRWSRRLMAFVGAGWLAMLLGLVLITAIILAAYSEELRTAAARGAAVEIAQAHLAFRAMQDPAVSAKVPGIENWKPEQVQGPYSIILEDFVEVMDFELLFANAGGWKSIWTASLVVDLVLFIALFYSLGIMWATVLAHLRWPRLLLVIPIILGFTAIFMLMSHRDMTTRSWGWNWASFLASANLYWRLNALFLFLSIVPLSLGLMTGRGIARWLIRLLVPPRMREPLFFLWFTDGKAPPRSVLADAARGK